MTSVDHNREYGGGIVESFVSDPGNTYTHIFFDVDDPDRNVPASSLIFNKLVWK